MEDPVTNRESRLFQDVIILFDNRQWAMARDKVQQIINQYPQSPYAEKARFLLIDILQELYGNDPGARFRILTQSFQDVLNRYPDSPYKGGALLGLARLHRSMGNHAEALAYYELARSSSSDQDGWIGRQAMLDMAKIYRATNRMTQALLVLEDIVTTTGYAAIQNEARLEIAKIRYDQNFFSESLTLLKELVSRDKEVYFQYPDVSLYTGNNYFQTGRYDLAAKHLFHYYNTAPETVEKGMILARVGDAFLQDGKVMDAVRYFQFVVDRYPDSRGAAVSWLRLAELKEKYPDDRIPISYSAKQVYENIRDSYQGRPIDDSLALLAILKLAVLYQEEEQYPKSLKTLHLFFENHPDGSLRENGRFALKNVLEAMIRDAYANKDYNEVISMYQQDARPVLSLMDLDSVHLMVARAYHHLGEHEAAQGLYQQLGTSMSLENMPDDVLYFTGKALFESGGTEVAEKRLSRLISAYPQSPYAGDAMNLMGQILMTDEKFQEAVAMMTRALAYPLSPCDRNGLLVRKARAALAARDMEAILSALDSARETVDQCPALAGYLGDQIGDLYFQAGHFDQAGSMYTHVLEMADSQVEPAFLQYKTALSLWRAGQQEQGLAFFETLAAQNDPFWSPLAREHLASVAFDKTVR
jgi:TolA-binding protein